jgi:hypothetical protein
MRRAAVRMSMVGENVALGMTPDDAHAALMNSPGHRLNILRPHFTHVGIGVLIEKNEFGGPQLIATQVFGRRPAPSEARQTTETVVAAIHQLRKVQGLPAAHVDPVLAAAAEAGLGALTSHRPTDAESAARKLAGAVSGVIGSHVKRSGEARSNACTIYIQILERLQLAAHSELLDPRLARFGVAVRVLEDDQGPRSALVLVLQGAGTSPLACK